MFFVATLRLLPPAQTPPWDAEHLREHAANGG